ncbi:MAG: tRNA uridine-5-carboxymethylaminomethyl(34) synthesis GTPase MnmE [Prevotellaceae bacterium]|jgi:tRNA modification GTPase|nr:tRNA uridine-5-carboxymethylaminomethyl(34) synthesis GTPase MnmE [Prevotellaceae bacterium]
MIETLPTIAAISTAPGKGAIACIRVSGKDVYAICNKIFQAKNGKSIEEQAVHNLCFGLITDDGNVLDEVLLAKFQSPHSYTGEDIVEITCHGSVYIQQKILQLLLKHGVHLAKAGEFTQRAFMNGRIDLSQAEAVADLIASSSSAAHRIALNQMRGGFSNELRNLRNELLDFISLIELELDFGEEDVEFADRSRLNELSGHIAGVIKKLADSFEAGNVIKNGIPVAIIGETNTGKSTLLNFLLNEDRAIVSNIHGTTRDIIEDITSIEGITFRFIDTAGIRETHDTVENIGIERTFQKINQASIILWLVDALNKTSDIQKLAQKIIPLTGGKKLIMVLNKVDLLDKHEIREKEAVLNRLSPGSDLVSISATLQTHTDALIHKLVKASALSEIKDNDVIITNMRHYEALNRAYDSTLRVIDGLKNNISGDFLSQDIREALHYLGEITGEISTNDILENIFSKFCIGK